MQNGFNEAHGPNQYCSMNTTQPFHIAWIKYDLSSVKSKSHSSLYHDDFICNQEHLENFYEEVFLELAKFGEAKGQGVKQCGILSFIRDKVPKSEISHLI